MIIDTATSAGAGAAAVVVLTKDAVVAAGAGAAVIILQLIYRADSRRHRKDRVKGKQYVILAATSSCLTFI